MIAGSDNSINVGGEVIKEILGIDTLGIDGVNLDQHFFVFSVSLSLLSMPFFHCLSLPNVVHCISYLTV